MLPGKSIGCSLFAAFVAATSMPAGTSADIGRAIPPGQEELLSQMLGRDATLPGNCRFAGGGVEATLVVAEYTCGHDTVIVELRNADDAPASVLRTQLFAIVVRSGTGPPGLLEALTASVRAREAAFEWRQVSLLQRHVFGLGFGPAALAGCAGVILLVTLVVQYLVANRRDTPQISEPHRFAGRGRIVALGELLGRWQRSRDLRVLATLGLVAIFLFTRMSFLTRLPAYVDESVHLHWARGFLDPDFTAEFSVGRWLAIRIMALFLLLPVDPLFAARFGSVTMGLAVLVGCILINRELFSSTEGLLAGVVYTVLPYALLYDRMALADIYLVAFGAWALYSSILAARRPGPAPIMAMSLCTYGAILSKPTGGVFLVVPILVSLFLLAHADRGAYLKRVWPTLVGGLGLLGFLVWAGYGTGLLASQVAFDGRGQLSSVLIPNLAEARAWFTAMLTPPVALLTMVAGLGALIAGLFGARAELFLVFLLALAVLPSALISRTWYPSYLLFALVPISLLLARAITVAVARLPLPFRRAGYFAAILLVVGATAPLDVALMTRPEDAALPLVESSRYISGGLSGYGLPELARFLRAEAQTQPLNVVRFDLAQPPREGLDVYLSATDAIHLYAIDHLDERAATQLATLAKTRRTLFVSNPEAEEPMGAAASKFTGGAARIWSHVRPGADTRLEVWELKRDGQVSGPTSP